MWIRNRWRPSRTHLISGALVIAGFLAASLSWWFFLLVGAGLFGPGILREMGWLQDKDEFQRVADYRAGYHAFLTAGLVAIGLVAFTRSGERAIQDPQELATLFLALLCFTSIFSALLAYWGVQKTVARILYGFGCAWLMFAIVSNTGSEWTGWGAMLLQPLITLPFIGCAWLAGRWPRITGLVLVGAAVFFVQFFGMFRNDNQALINQVITFILFVGPILASGIALLAVGGDDDDEDEE